LVEVVGDKEVADLDVATLPVLQLLVEGSDLTRQYLVFRQ
jgi:hypothetical protein